MDIIDYIRKLKNITIETKDKRTITGQLKKVDKQMNILILIKETNDEKIIKGTNLRYIIFDDEL
ncbi:hypothetical protein M153_7411000874 [Pseudoloma neurophilia]|uniref:Sm domain-containing protein n=1 Tax=Pseudoloma neurophilia TaxID=146866 RepID=A0A0R0M1U9_9MICR|nr:hypothetical protein M153_7411000874 [Pseudoloma neurophilia]